MLEMIPVFSDRLYGSRSHKNQQVLDALKAAANEVAGKPRRSLAPEAAQEPVRRKVLAVGG